MSMRALTAPIISSAQQASPNVAGMNALPRAQLAAFSIVVVIRRLLDELVEVGVLELAFEHLAGAQLAGAELAVVAVAELLTSYFHSRAPLRHT